MEYLEFEKPLEELVLQMEKAQELSKESEVDVSATIKDLEKKLEKCRKDIYRNLSPWQKVQLSRHPNRPYTLDYIQAITKGDFVELHGDRGVKDDKAMIGGWGTIEGKSVMLAAGDTFRAAAVEQLQVWGERNDIPVIAQKTGADAASVVYDAYQSAIAKNIDILIADTAGRLHTQDNLMQELEKIKRVLKKHNENAPHETLLVIDGGSGQNAIQQANEFHKSINLSGLAVTKLDGTAKGGVLFAISDSLKLPIRYIGVGEAIDDLKPFNGKDFVDALFD